MSSAKKQKTDVPAAGGAGTMSAPMSVENVAGESDFNSLTQWLMANTKDKEVQSVHPSTVDLPVRVRDRV